MFKNEVIIYALFNAEFEKNAQVGIYSLADLNLGHCVVLTFFEGKLGGFFMVKVYLFGNRRVKILTCSLKRSVTLFGKR